QRSDVAHAPPGRRPARADRAGGPRRGAAHLPLSAGRAELPRVRRDHGAQRQLLQVRQLRLDQRLLVGAARTRAEREGRGNPASLSFCLLRMESILYACEVMTMNRVPSRPFGPRSWILLSAAVISLLLLSCGDGATAGGVVGSKPDF